MTSLPLTTGKQVPFWLYKIRHYWYGYPRCLPLAGIFPTWLVPSSSDAASDLPPY